MTTARTTLIALTILALAASAAPALAQAKKVDDLVFPPLRPFNVPQPEKITLDNGMQIMLLEDRELPLIDMTARIRTGSRLEPAGKNGLASIFGSVLRTGGTKKMTGDQIDEYLEARAAEIETGVGETMGFATLSCLTQDFDDVLKVFVDILRNPVFSKDKIELAKNQENAGIARRNDDPVQIMNREFASLIYGADSPYARTTEYATIDAISRDDLIAWHRQYLHPNRIILGVSGDFNAQEMATKLKAAFSGWPKGSEASDPPAAYQAKTKPGIYYVPKEDMTQSDIIMGHLGITKDNPDIYAVDVMSEAFGGGTFTARLYSNIRSKKGLAYNATGGVGSNYDYPGTFNASMYTKTETTAAGMDALLEEIDKIVTDPPDAQHVQLVKDSILNSFIFNFDSKAEILADQTRYAYYGFPTDWLATYRENIEKVTPEDVARVAKKYIHKDNLVILVVGPSEGLDRPLDSFGPVAKLDITIPEPEAAAAPEATAESRAKGKVLFAKMIDALGGPKAVDAVKAVQTTTDAKVTTPQGEMVLKVTTTVALPGNQRQEIQTPMGTMVMVLAGDEGFMNTPMGTQPLQDSQKSEMAKSTRRQLYALAQKRDDPALQVQYIGKDEVGGEPAEVLLVDLGGDPLRLFIDPASGLVKKQVYRGQTQGVPGEVVVTFGDFRDVSGLTFPFKWQATFNGEPSMSVETQEIVVNPPVDAAMFAKPETAAAAEGGGQK